MGPRQQFKSSTHQRRPLHADTHQLIPVSTSTGSVLHFSLYMFYQAINQPLIKATWPYVYHLFVCVKGKYISVAIVSSNLNSCMSKLSLLISSDKLTMEYIDLCNNYKENYYYYDINTRVEVSNGLSRQESLPLEKGKNTVYWLLS